MAMLGTLVKSVWHTVTGNRNAGTKLAAGGGDLAESRFVGEENSESLGERIGTAGAMELRVPVGARQLALGGADIAGATGAEALYWNPAGIAAGEATDLLLTHTEYLSTMQVEYAGLTSHAMGGTIGASFKALSLGDLIVTTEDSPDGTGEVSTPTFTVAQLGSAKQMTDKVRFGGSVSLISEKILQSQATGLCADFGFQYDPLWRGLKFGFAMKNFGPNMRFGGSDFEHSVTLDGGVPTVVETQSAAFELPSYVNFGVTRVWNVGASSHAMPR